MSLLPCMQNAVTLEVYLDENDEATGSLYVDDGESLDYLTKADSYAEVQFSMSGETLRSSLTSGSKAAFGANQKVTQLTFYGFHSAPYNVLAGAIEVDFIYVAANEALYVNLLQTPQDLDAVWIEVVWN